jgi:hypothetical protein
VRDVPRGDALDCKNGRADERLEAAHHRNGRNVALVRSRCRPRLIEAELLAQPRGGHALQAAEPDGFDVAPSCRVIGGVSGHKGSRARLSSSSLTSSARIVRNPFGVGSVCPQAHKYALILELSMGSLRTHTKCVYVVPFRPARRKAWLANQLTLFI